MQESITANDSVAASLVMPNTVIENIVPPHIIYTAECYGPSEANREEYLDLLSKAAGLREEGRIIEENALLSEAALMVERKWEEVFHNLVTNEGRNDLIDKYFKGSSYTAAWYMGLKGTGSAAAGDTLASHAGWSELTPYTGNRKTITWGTTASQSNSATAVSFAITGTASVYGAFVASVNSGSSGILYSAGDFAASRSVVNGDTLNVTPTVTT